MVKEEMMSQEDVPDEYKSAKTADEKTAELIRGKIEELKNM